jgi:hypothetical protein
MKIGMVPTAKLQRRRTNYRAMTDPELAALRNSVEKFGFKSFIVVTKGKEDDTYDVVDGHHRWQTAQSLKMENVPVVMLEQDANGTDLAMLSFNVQADVIPDVYVDFLKELSDRLGPDTLAAFTGIDDAFLKDLGATLQAVNVGEINLGTGAEDDTSDRSRGSAINISLPSTPEIESILKQMMEVFRVNTPAEAVLAALKHLRDMWAPKEKKP